MGIMKLTRAEKVLVKDVEHGDETVFKVERETISAEVLRHIVLGLPLFRLGGPFGREVACRITGAGVSITNAIINGPIRLDAAIGGSGGPLYPLSFTDCHFQDCLSARYAHFSHLSFSECTFGAPEQGGHLSVGHLVPTIDLTGARLDGPLDMEGIRPQPESGELWIRAASLRAGGSINLARARLRSPTKAGEAAESARTPEREDAIDLNGASIDGDLCFNNGATAEGRLALRGVQLSGNLWLNIATLATVGAETEALFLQGARIGGFLSTRKITDPPKQGFDCTGKINLTAAEVGRSLILKVRKLIGDIDAPDLTVQDDLFLHGEVDGAVDLQHSTIGGSLDMSALAMTRDADKLSLRDATIGRSLRLAPSAGKTAEAGFELHGVADLRGLTCDTLLDDSGASWGSPARILMNRFVYRQASWHVEGRGKKESHEIFGHKLLAAQAEGRRPWRWLMLGRWAERLRPGTWLLARQREGRPLLKWIPSRQRLDREDYWEPWQIRRNWIYRHFHFSDGDLGVSARCRVHESEYRPQPFEQAIRVARTEGREDYATHFEILKQWIEWGVFNRLVRWWLGFVALALAAGWLLLSYRPASGWWADPTWLVITLGILFVTLFLMMFASTIHRVIAREVPPRGRSWIDADGKEHVKGHWFHEALTWIVFFAPTAGLIGVSGWWRHPFHAIVAFLIFMVIRFISVIAHGVMRVGFGYLRRPVRAIATLIFAFVIGWWGVAVANRHNMLVVAAEPVAPLAGAQRPAAEGPGHVEWLMGSENVGGGERFIRDLSCAHEISEPLYALDVLVPLVDLREESRCEIRRVPAARRVPLEPDALGFPALVRSIPEMTVGNHRFWWLMKALYAIAGWVIVSLAILTFAQANRVHAEPARGEG